MNYNDPIYGIIELQLIDVLTSKVDEIITTEEIYKMPSGDYIVFLKRKHDTLGNINFSQEFFVKGNWVKSILKEITGKIINHVEV